MENLGWGFLMDKIRRFAHNSNVAKTKPFKSYKEVAAILPWPNLALNISSVSNNLSLSKVDFVVEEKSCNECLNFLERCL